MRMFIRDFLESRLLTVRIGNVLSEKTRITSGVPQGSVTSPLLFLIMIKWYFNDLEEDIPFSLYADHGAM